MTPEDAEENQLRFCYYKQGEFVNRPLTISPSEEAADRTDEIVETMASLTRTFTADEIEALIEEFGEERSSNSQCLLRNSARADSRRSSTRKPTDSSYPQYLISGR
jgi:hypothetical protein